MYFSPLKQIHLTSSCFGILRREREDRGHWLLWVVNVKIDVWHQKCGRTWRIVNVIKPKIVHGWILQFNDQRTPVHAETCNYSNPFHHHPPCHIVTPTPHSILPRNTFKLINKKKNDHRRHGDTVSLHWN